MNVWKRISFVLGYCAIGLIGINSASAQVRAAYVKNVDEPGRIPYSQMAGFSPEGCAYNACNNFNHSPDGYRFSGDPIPAGKRFVAQWVSGEIPAATGYNTIAIMVGPATHVWQFAGPFYSYDSHGQTPIQSFGTPAFFTVEPGASPAIRVRMQDPSPGYQTSIVISGYLIDANN